MSKALHLKVKGNIDVVLSSEPMDSDMHVIVVDDLNQCDLDWFAHTLNDTDYMAKRPVSVLDYSQYEEGEFKLSTALYVAFEIERIRDYIRLASMSLKTLPKAWPRPVACSDGDRIVFELNDDIELIMAYKFDEHGMDLDFSTVKMY